MEQKAALSYHKLELNHLSVIIK